MGSNEHFLWRLLFLQVQKMELIIILITEQINHYHWSMQGPVIIVIKNVNLHSEPRSLDMSLNICVSRKSALLMYS